jgi:hypothetical protein
MRRRPVNPAGPVAGSIRRYDGGGNIGGGNIRPFLVLVEVPLDTGFVSRYVADQQGDILDLAGGVK